MHRDTVIGIVGVVILVAAMIGVFTYEKGQAGSVPEGAGTLQNMTGPSTTGNVPVGETAESIVSLDQTGMTNVTFTLRWTPGAQSIDTVRLSAAPSNGTGMTTGGASDAETDGEIVLVVPVPNTGADGVIGVGEWQLVVEFVSAQTASPAGGPAPVPVPGTTDTAIDFTIDASVQAYATT